MTQATHSALASPVDIINARIPGYKELQTLLVNRQGIIEQILPMTLLAKRVPPAGLRVLDVAGNWVSLGGVDLQINGGLGLAFPDLTTANSQLLPKIAEFLWEQGIDEFLPTLVTTSVANIHTSLAVMADYMQNQTSGAKIIGVHLEGPFLNAEKCGAHPPEYLLPLTLKEVKRVLGDSAQLVKIITLAPELDQTEKVIPYLRSLGITVSLGHSQATTAQAQRAFELGASMVTHAFNAMPPLHHREPGLLGAAITHPHVMCGFIADGQHIAPTMLQILLRASRYNQGLFLVSDALAPLGLPDGTYPWDNREIEVKNHTAKLPDGTLSGTTLPLLQGAQNLVKWGICDAERAILLATQSPRQAIGEPGLGLGKPASQLLRWQLNEKTGDLSWRRLFRK